MLKEKKKEGLLPIGFVALFFGKTVSWLRWCEAQDYFRHADGQSITPLRVKKEGGKSFQRRQYSYQDIIDMADSLLRLEKITEFEHSRIITRVITMRS
jgi:hypothetical protein